MNLLIVFAAAALAAELPPMPVQPAVSIEPSQNVRADKETHIEIELKLPKGWRLHPREKFLYRISEFIGAVKVDPKKRKGWVENPKFPIKIPFTPPQGQSLVVAQVAFYYCPRDLDRCKAFSRYYRFPLTTDSDSPSTSHIPLLVNPAAGTDLGDQPESPLKKSGWE